MQSTADRILFELKTRGPATTRDVAARAGITRQAAREHLTRLRAAALVEHENAPSRVGRPGHAWSLTQTGHARFPNTHAQTTIELIEAVRSEFGEAGLARMVTRREQSMLAKYEQTLHGARTFDERVVRLAQLRSGEGYMADAFRRDDGSFLFIENHCPICAAASACQAFCQSELALFARLLAPARVERSEHLLAGGQRCCYLVTPRQA